MSGGHDEVAQARAGRIARALGALFVETPFPVVAIDDDGRIVAANPATERAYQWSLGELLSMRIHDLQASDRPIDAELSRARAVSGDAFEPRPHRRKDGTRLWVVPVAGPIAVEGERLLVSSLMDVSATVEAQARALALEELAARQRRAAEVLWQVAVERLTEGVLLLDASFKIVRANARAAELLHGADALVGRACRDVFPQCREALVCPHERAIASGEQVLIERAGSEGAASMRVEILPVLPPHEGLAVLHVMRDLAPEHAARSQLVLHDRLSTMGRIAASVAHEVNNPVAYLLLQLELARSQLAQGRRTPAEIVPMLDESIAGARQIAQIVRDLTGFMRDRGRSPTDLSAAVASALRIAAVETRAVAEIDARLDDAVIANVHGARVVQVVLNLVLNAAQAVERARGRDGGGHIEVRTYVEGDRACISVVDDGGGVPSALTARIFEAFFTTRADAGGTGIGLWLSRGLIEEEGGRLWFENVPASDAVDARSGARFIVELPLYPRP
jgi:PAS domain S-box-containing protein